MPHSATAHISSPKPPSYDPLALVPAAASWGARAMALARHSSSRRARTAVLVATQPPACDVSDCSFVFSSFKVVDFIALCGTGSTGRPVRDLPGMCATSAKRSSGCSTAPNLCQNRAHAAASVSGRGTMQSILLPTRLRCDVHSVLCDVHSVLPRQLASDSGQNAPVDVDLVTQSDELVCASLNDTRCVQARCPTHKEVTSWGWGLHHRSTHTT